MERTPEDFKTAIESMSRIRAVESLPDKNGERTIWHRAINGVELISWVQADGTLSAQTLNAWGHSVLWRDSTGLSTAHIDGASGLAEVVVSHATPNAQLIERLTTALAPYAGEDKFIGHFKSVLSGTGDIKRRVTREAEAFKPPAKFVSVLELKPIADAVAKQPPPKPEASTGLIIAGIAIALGAALAFWLIFFK